MIKRSLVLAAALSLWAGPVRAADSVEQKVEKIIDQFYDLQFDAATASAKDLVSEHPDHPAGYFLESVADFQRYLLQENPRESAPFDSFLALNEESLHKAVKWAAISEAASQYYQGAALGFQTRAYVSQKKYVLAIPRARQGAAHLRKALELDPSLVDANLGLGMYYYFLDRVPSAAKPFAYLLVGMKGDRQRGLALLEQTAEKGHTAREEAKSILASIYASESEKQWDKAQVLFEELMKLYPHNPRFRLGLVYVLQQKGLWERSIAVMDANGPWLRGLDPSWRARAQIAAWYRTAESLLFAGRFVEAGRLLDHLESGAPVKRMSDWVSLRRGNYWDALGRPAKAKGFYAAVQHKKAKALAHVFAQTPFPRGPRDVMPNHWPVSNLPE